MIPLLHHRSLWTLDELSRRDVLALLDTARSLKHSHATGGDTRLLRGKNVALLSDVDPAAHPFDAAAAALGARVSRIAPSASRLGTDADVQATARLLGRLYDAIECEGLEPALVEAIERHAGVPVFNGLSAPDHPMRVLADLLTMTELTGKPLEALSVCVHADPPHGSALLRTAGRTGVGVHDVHACHGRGGTACGADFQYDGASAALTRTDAPDASLEAQRDENRQYALQAMLLSALT
jgi:ornithine carbamoyltransferase